MKKQPNKKDEKPNSKQENADPIYKKEIDDHTIFCELCGWEHGEDFCPNE
jgi:hypothetical protein